jgi:hypothetical protein
MKLMINESKYNSTIRQYLDKVFGDLECLISDRAVSWYKDGRVVAMVLKNSDRLQMSAREFKPFIGLFSLPWENDDDDKVITNMIVPYLKFDGGTPAIPVLVKLGFIKELSHTALPSQWD